MINIFQLTTCNYSEGLIPLISVFLTVDAHFQVVGTENSSEGAVCFVCLWHTCSSALGLWNCLLIWKSAAIEWHAFFAYVHFLEIVSAAHLKLGEITEDCWNGIWDWAAWKTKRLQGESCRGRDRLQMLSHGGWQDLGKQESWAFPWNERKSSCAEQAGQ